MKEDASGTNDSVCSEFMKLLLFGATILVSDFPHWCAPLLGGSSMCKDS